MSEAPAVWNNDQLNALREGYALAVGYLGMHGSDTEATRQGVALEIIKLARNACFEPNRLAIKSIVNTLGNSGDLGDFSRQAEAMAY